MHATLEGHRFGGMWDKICDQDGIPCHDIERLLLVKRWKYRIIHQEVNIFRTSIAKYFLNLVNLHHAEPGSELRERLVQDVEITATSK